MGTSPVHVRLPQVYGTGWNATSAVSATNFDESWPQPPFETTISVATHVSSVRSVGTSAW